MCVMFGQSAPDGKGRSSLQRIKTVVGFTHRPGQGGGAMMKGVACRSLPREPPRWPPGGFAGMDERPGGAGGPGAGGTGGVVRCCGGTKLVP